MAITRRRTRALAAAPVRGPILIDRLSDELLLEIFETLKSDSKPALLTATAVCLKWHILAQKVIDSNICPLIIGPTTRDRNTKLFSRMKRDAGFQQRVRHLSIEEWYLTDMNYYVRDDAQYNGIVEDPYRDYGYFSRSWSESERQNDPTWPQMKLLADAVVKLPLSTFSWTATPCMPKQLAHALAQNTHCKVQIRPSVLAEEYMKISYGPISNHQAIETLQSLSENLTCLRVMIPAADTTLLHAIGTLAWSSPRLRDLGVSAIGCLWYAQIVPFALRGTRSGSFSTVTDLDWLLRPDSKGSNDVLRLSGLDLSNVCICADSRRLAWIEHVDWNRLESLALTCITLLELVSRRTPRLTSLTLTLVSGRDCEFATCASKVTAQHATAILENFGTLQHLELINGTELLTPNLLGTIGGNLRSLTAHERTQARWQIDRIRPLLSSDVLRYIGSSCPKISHLGIDVPFSDIPYLAFIYDLAYAVPSITSLAVYREIEGIESDILDPPRSAVTISSVRNDFTHLQERNGLLLRFDIHITSMPPFYLDKLHLEGNNPFIFWQRRLTVESVEVDREGRERSIQIQSEGVERATRAVKHAASGIFPKQWEYELSQHKQLAEEAFDFYWKPAQPY